MKAQQTNMDVIANNIANVSTNGFKKARAEFEVESKKVPYFSMVPPDAKPDLELNRVEMEKYRADMRKFYLNKAPRFN